MENLKQAKDLINNSQTICIASHIRPDGDAIGSMGAMYFALKGLGKEVEWIIAEKTDSFDFMPGIANAICSTIKNEYDLLIVLDCSDVSRININKADYDKANKILLIDHHTSSVLIGDVNIVENNAPASCEIIYDLLKYMDINITKQIADYIYLGLLTDTGSFNYERTTEKTYKIAGEMVGHGADFVKICKSVNDTHSENKMKLIAYVINNTEKYMDGKVRICVVDKNTLDGIGAKPEEKEGLVNYIRCIEGTLVAIIIIALDDKNYKVSIRTEEPVDAAYISKIFGGGGHVRASGFETNDVEHTKKNLIELLERLLESESNRNT